MNEKETIEEFVIKNVVGCLLYILLLTGFGWIMVNIFHCH
mgnify:CR=1 FL=1